MTNILIGGAWPYANGQLHIGHIAALLPGDILARYYRAKGERVFYVSGSDCHGTPITLRAKQESTSPEEISEYYHREFCKVFRALGFSYDLYTKTSDEQHKAFVIDFHKKLYESDLIEERTVKQAYCPVCSKVLTDRLITGICPACGAPTRGDQCDACGEVLEADTILDARCAACESVLTFGQTRQLFLKISAQRQVLCEYLNAHPHWRKNAIAFTMRYIDGGLRDRAITRDLDWGIDVPKAGYEDKKIYIWAENVLGYLSAAAVLCRERGISFEDIFGADARHYYVHGKDNIPFHTIILPSLLLAYNAACEASLRLPDDIISSEYMTLEGAKISTSRNHAIWAKDLTEAYNPDSIRYFFIANGPEKRDSDFTLREFREQNNTELVGAWGNFCNRTLAFVVKYLGNRLPDIGIDSAIEERVEVAYPSVGDKIERGAFKEALEEIFELVRFGNRYYDAEQPWRTRTSDKAACRRTIGNCAYLIANLAVMLKPFLPFSSEKILRWLGAGDEWSVQEVTTEELPTDFGVLFARIQ